MEKLSSDTGYFKKPVEINRGKESLSQQLCYIRLHKNFVQLLSFSSHFSFWLTSYKKQKHYEIVCLFFIIFHFCLACLALQTENIIQKITQPIFVLVTSSTKTKNKKWDEKLINHHEKNEFALLEHQ